MPKCNNVFNDIIFAFAEYVVKWIMVKMTIQNYNKMLTRTCFRRPKLSVKLFKYSVISFLKTYDFRWEGKAKSGNDIISPGRLGLQNIAKDDECDVHLIFDTMHK